MIAAGASFLVGLLHVHFRDTGLIWGILLQALFWLTPVVYVVDGPLAELLQHEMDHLDGILAVDRAIGRESFCTREEYERRHAGTR